MSTVSAPMPILDAPAASRAAGRGGGALPFAAAFLALAVCAAALAGLAPLGFSIVTVFLFAGPHNWMEFRYFLTRMPARWGPMRPFFLTAIAGVVALTAMFIAMPILGRRQSWGDAGWANASATWNTVLLLWTATLVRLHFRKRGGAAADWVLPLACLLTAVVWWRPQAWDIAIVYSHPLFALWFLDREIKRRRPAWRRAYHVCLLAIPLLLAVMWWRLADAPPLAGLDMLSMRITRHVGAGLLSGLSAHALVATHTFLEMLHYSVWLLALPLVSRAASPLRLTGPLVRRSAAWRRAVIGVVTVGALVVFALWAGFLANYPLTRDVYFTVAIAHVLAEVPFLLRTF